MGQRSALPTSGSHEPRKHARDQRWLRWFAVPLAIYAGAASAQTQATSVGLAQALFEDGRALMTEGSLALACAKLEESSRLDPGVGTTLSWADCEEQRGHVARAWSLWLEAASRARDAKQQDRETLARDRAARAREKLGTLTIDVPSSARISGLDISIDSSPLPASEWGTEAPFDVGEHVISVNAPGRRDVLVKVRVAAGRAVVFHVPELTRLAAAAAGSRSPVAPNTTQTNESLSAGSSGIFRSLTWLSGAATIAMLAAITLRRSHAATSR